METFRITEDGTCGFEIASDRAEQLLASGAFLRFAEGSYYLNPEHLFTAEEVGWLLNGE
jgi:hypothetical protein